MADESNEITVDLLRMVLEIVRENIPEPAGDWLRRVIRQTPQVLYEGKKKTVVVNFMDICNTMHRQPHHVSAFLRHQFGTRCSLDEQQRTLVVMWRFKLRHVETFLKWYVVEYVLCFGCKSVDTILSRENRVFFLRCEKCGSGRQTLGIPWK